MAKAIPHPGRIHQGEAHLQLFGRLALVAHVEAGLYAGKCKFRRQSRPGLISHRLDLDLHRLRQHLDLGAIRRADVASRRLGRRGDICQCGLDGQ